MKRATPTSCPTDEHIVEFPLNFSIELDFDDIKRAHEEIFLQEQLEKLSNFTKFASCFKLYKINKIHLCIDMANIKNISTANRYPLFETTWLNRPGLFPKDETLFNGEETFTTIQQLIRSSTNKKTTVFYPGSEFHITEDITPKTLNEKMFYMPTRVMKAPLYEFLEAKDVNIESKEYQNLEAVKNQDTYGYFNPIFYMIAVAESETPEYDEDDKKTHGLITLQVQAFIEVSFQRFISTKLAEFMPFEMTHKIILDETKTYDGDDILETIKIEINGQLVIINLKVEDKRLTKPLTGKKIITITQNGLYTYT